MYVVILSSQCQQILRSMPKILYQSRHYFNTMTMFHARLFMFALFFCCLLGSRAHAQGSNRSTVSLTSPSETITDEVPRLPWTVGTDLLQLFRLSYLPGNSIFAKRNIQAENKLPGAIRMRVGLNLEIRDNNDPNSVTNEAAYFGGFIRPGYEWQKQLGKHQVFYGVDLHLAYDHSYNEVNQDTRFISRTTRRNWGVGTVGIIGYQYFLSPHISFSTEAAYEVILNRGRIEIDNAPFDPSDVLNSVQNNTSMESDFRPLYVVNFNFHF